MNDRMEMLKSTFPIIRGTTPNTVREKLYGITPKGSSVKYKEKEPFMRFRNNNCFDCEPQNPKLYLNLEQHPIKETVDAIYFFVYIGDEIVLEEITEENLTIKDENDIIKHKRWEILCEEFNKLSLEERWKIYKEKENEM